MYRIFVSAPPPYITICRCPPTSRSSTPTSRKLSISSSPIPSPTCPITPPAGQARSHGHSIVLSWVVVVDAEGQRHWGMVRQVRGVEVWEVRCGREGQCHQGMVC